MLSHLEHPCHSSAAIRFPLISPASSQPSSLQGGPGRPQARLPHPPPAPEALCIGSLNPCSGPGSLSGYLSTRTLMCGSPRPLLVWHPSSPRLLELQDYGSRPKADRVPQPGPSHLRVGWGPWAPQLGDQLLTVGSGAAGSACMAPPPSGSTPCPARCFSGEQLCSFRQHDREPLQGVPRALPISEMPFISH